MKGFILLAKQVIDSDIWNKPEAWFKIWIYILVNVNYEDTKKFKRGEGYFNFLKEYRTIGKGVKYDHIRHFLSYARDEAMISTTRSTRGMKIKVLNYDKYQDIKEYNSSTEKHCAAQEKHKRSSPIPNEYKEEKEITNNTMADKSAGYLLNTKPISMEELTYEYDNAPKKYSNKRKLYSRIAIYYMGLQGEQGNILRYFKDIKELVEIAEKQYPEFNEEKIESEIKGRIDKWRSDQEAKNLSWGLSGVITHWNRILKS